MVLARYRLRIMQVIALTAFAAGLLVVLTLFAMIGGSETEVHAQSQIVAELAIISPTITVELGEVFSVTVRVQTSQAVDGAAAYLDFDASRLQVREIIAGADLPIMLQSEYDNVLGQLAYAAGALSAPFPAEEFVLATVFFEAIGVTESTQLTFSAIAPRISDVTGGGSSLLGSLHHGTVTVRSVSTPTFTPTVTKTATATLTPTPTIVPTTTATQTPPATNTPLSTSTPTASSTATPTVVQTGTAMPSSTPIVGITETPPGLVLTGIEPNQGLNTVPSSVILMGTGLRPDTLLTIGGVQLHDVSTAGNTGKSLMASIPAGLSAGRHDVAALNPDNSTALLRNAYTVIDASLLDLAVTDADLWLEPATVRQDQAATLGVNVHRSGGNDLLTGVVVEFYLDEVAPNGLIGSATLPPMEYGVDIVSSTSIIWTPTTAGAYVIYAVIDATHSVTEGSESNNEAQWPLVVLPTETSLDSIAPIIQSLKIAGDLRWTASPTITLLLDAVDNMDGADLASMYLVERIYSNAARRWITRQQSGWVDFHSAFEFAPSAPGGVHYFQAWVADAAGNTSAVAAVIPLNYLHAGERLLKGQARIYRLYLSAGETLQVSVSPSDGDPDLYIWHESGARVGYSNAFDLQMDTVVITASQSGQYQIEVHAYLDSVYTLSLQSTQDVFASGQTASSKSVLAEPVVAPQSVPSSRQVLPAAPQLPVWNLFMPAALR